MIWCLKAYKFTGKDSRPFCPFCLLCSLLDNGVSWGQLAGPAASHASVHLRAKGSGELLLRSLICVCGLSFSSRLAWLLPKIGLERAPRKQGETSKVCWRPSLELTLAHSIPHTGPAGKGRKTDGTFKGRLQRAMEFSQLARRDIPTPQLCLISSSFWELNRALKKKNN